MSSIHQPIVFFILCIFLISLFAFHANSLLVAAEEAEVKIDMNDEDKLDVGDTLKVKIQKKGKAIHSTKLPIPDNTKIVEEEVEKSSEHNSHLDIHTEEVEIHWDKKGTEITIPLKVTDDSQELELMATSETNGETLETEIIQVDVNQSKKKDVKEASDDNQNKNTEEENDEQEQEQDEEDVNHNSVTDTNDETSERKEEKSETPDKQKNDTISAQDANESSVEVDDWKSFVNALEDKDVYEIEVIEDISANTAASLYKYTVDGDKKISGNNHSINVKRNRIKIQNHHVIVNNTIFQSRLNNLPKSSIFYSDQSDALLHLHNTSYDGIQRGQIAKMKEGNIKVSGSSIFQTKGPFEVFEAQNITFMEGVEFTGETTISGTGQKEVINLYNDATVTIEPNASVTLKTQGRKPIIQNEDNSSSTINIQDKGTLQIYADNKTTSNGKPLINFPGSNSSITVGKDATFDIQNHREGRQLGELISMHGSLKTTQEGSKISYWNKGSNSDKREGEEYIHFPRILAGELTFETTEVTNVSADKASSPAQSEDKDKDGKTFQEVFGTKDMDEIKRLNIAAVDRPETPEIHEITDQDTSISGKTSPDLDVEIQDEEGKIHEPKIDKETGEFSIDLEKAYKAGKKLTAVSIDTFGAKSEETTTTVVGTTLSFEVPKTLDFQTTVIQDKETIIERDKKNWGIDLYDSRPDGSEWIITAHAPEPFKTEDGQELPSDALVFVDEGNIQSLEEEVRIAEGTADKTNEQTIDWGGNEGPLLQLNPLASNVRTNKNYTTSVEWTLKDAP